MNIRTDTSKRAREIFSDIQPRIAEGKPFLASYEVQEDIVKVQTRLRGILNENCLSYQVITAISDDTLFVKTRKVGTPREDKLVQMVRKLAGQVDNDALYEEALALVGTI